jgi:hypothetical protein
MPRASSILCLPAVLALATAAPAVELPIIVNGNQLVQAKDEPAPPPAAVKSQLPVIINYPSAALQAAPADGKGPVIIADTAGPRPIKPAPVRVAVAYALPMESDYMAPVAYNAYGIGSMLGVDAGLGYGVSSPYGAGLGYYGAYGYGGYSYAAYGPVAPWGFGLVPPRVEVLDTGIRPNAGRLTSMPSVRAPVYGQVMGVYYR